MLVQLTDCTRRVHELLHRVLPIGKGKHFWKDLCGACCIGAYAVRHVLWEDHRIRAVIVGDSEDPEHVWAKVGDVHLDPTYQQFDASIPYLVTLDHPQGDGVVLPRLPESWPDEQHPRTYWEALGFGTFKSSSRKAKRMELSL
jgi:hypothetical protein